MRQQTYHSGAAANPFFQVQQQNLYHRYSNKTILMNRNKTIVSCTATKPISQVQVPFFQAQQQINLPYKRQNHSLMNRNKTILSGTATKPISQVEQKTFSNVSQQKKVLQQNHSREQKQNHSLIRFGNKTILYLSIQPSIHLSLHLQSQYISANSKYLSIYLSICLCQ